MSYYGEGRYSLYNGLVVGRLPEVHAGWVKYYSRANEFLWHTHKLCSLRLKRAGLCVFLLLRNTHMHTDERRLRWIVGGIGTPWVCVSVAQKRINGGTKWGQRGTRRFRSNFPEWLALSGICREAKRQVQAQRRPQSLFRQPTFLIAAVSNKPH